MQFIWDNFSTFYLINKNGCSIDFKEENYNRNLDKVKICNKLVSFSVMRRKSGNLSEINFRRFYSIKIVTIKCFNIDFKVFII